MTLPYRHSRPKLEPLSTRNRARRGIWIFMPYTEGIFFVNAQLRKITFVSELLLVNNLLLTKMPTTAGLTIASLKFKKKFQKISNFF